MPVIMASVLLHLNVDHALAFGSDHGAARELVEAVILDHVEARGVLKRELVMMAGHAIFLVSSR